MVARPINFCTSHKSTYTSRMYYTRRPSTYVHAHGAHNKNNSQEHSSSYGLKTGVHAFKARSRDQGSATDVARNTSG
eukprot:scaffold73733_cov40-Tisochrysis_lutea.AAC.3